MKIALVALLPCVLYVAPLLAAEQQEAVVASISEYNSALADGDPSRVLSVVGESLFMFNGNYSSEPSGWQPHLFLTGQALAEWPRTYLDAAGPHLNTFKVLHVDIRGDAAIVVTSDTGSNKFRQWRNEQVVWMLGQHDRSWKIVSLFIRDIENPE